MSSTAVKLTAPAKIKPATLAPLDSGRYLPPGVPLDKLAPTARPDRPTELPVTSPTHKFDRASFASPEVRCPFDSLAEWQEHKTTLDEPLPEGIATPESVAIRLVIQAVEVLLGHRPVRQLQTWMAPEVFEALVRRASLAQRVDGRSAKCLPPRIRRIVTSRPRPRVAECSLVLFDGRKIRAAAVRLEVRRKNWHLMALEII